MKKKLIMIALTIVAILVMSGCSAKGPQFSGFKKPTHGQANVYIYRTSYLGAAITPEIYQANIDNSNYKVVGRIKPNGYIMTTITPGMYKFWATTEVKNEVILKVNPNKIYCIEHYISMGWLIGHPQFKIVDMRKCKEDIKETKLSIPEK
jgi:uncharacterized secreted protein with C-terminal beta-propeller domain